MMAVVCACSIWQSASQEQLLLPRQSRNYWLLNQLLGAGSMGRLARRINDEKCSRGRARQHAGSATPPASTAHGSLLVECPQQSRPIYLMGLWQSLSTEQSCSFFFILDISRRTKSFALEGKLGFPGDNRKSIMGRQIAWCYLVEGSRRHQPRKGLLLVIQGKNASSACNSISPTRWIAMGFALFIGLILREWAAKGWWRGIPASHSIRYARWHEPLRDSDSWIFSAPQVCGLPWSLGNKWIVPISYLIIVAI